MITYRSGRGSRRLTAVLVPLLITGLVLTIGQPAGAVGVTTTGGAHRGVVAAAVPGPPTLEELTPGDGEIQVNWLFGNPNLGVTGYTATASPGGETCDAPGRFSTQCTIDALTNGVEYTIRVVAHHLSDGDSAPSNALTATPNRSLTFSDVNVDQRRVSAFWRLRSIDPPQTFVVAIGSNPARGCQVDGGQNYCQIDLVPWGTHSIRITAVYADGTRNLTVSRTVTLTPPPANVTILGVTVTGHDANIYWTYPGGAEFYEAILQTDSGLTCGYGALPRAASAKRAGAKGAKGTGPRGSRAKVTAGIGAAVKRAAVKGAAVKGAAVKGAAVNGYPNCTIEDLPYGTYRVQVDAYDEGLEATSQMFTFVVAPPPPATPGGVRVTGGTSQIIASWSPPANSVVPVTGYRATASPGPASCTTTGATTCVIGGTAGQRYTVTVVALSAEGGESTPAGSANSAKPTLPVATDTPPETNLKLTTTKGRITSAVPGQDIVFVGKGFAAYSTVLITIYSAPDRLGVVDTNGSGNFRKRVTVPSNMAAGWHTVVAFGIAPDGTLRAMAIRIRIIGLAATGADLTTVLILGVLLVGGGATLLVLVRRRRFTWPALTRLIALAIHRLRSLRTTA